MHTATYAAIVAVLVIMLVYTSVLIHQAVKGRLNLLPWGRSSTPRRGPLRTLSKKDLLRERTFDEYHADVDQLVERALELGEFGEKGELPRACAYALRDGKRLRPIILLEICRASAMRGGGFPVDAADAALSIEFLHAASLIVDDLPAFDNDAERRGAPSVHAKTNPAVAQMAALSLVAAAFQDLGRQIDWIRDNCPEFESVDRVGSRLCHDVGQAIGAMGAAGGQLMDSTASEAELFDEHGSGAVLEIMQRKTASFFEIAFLTGWLVSGASPKEADELKRAGRYFGTAFQLADDVGDMAQDAARRAAGKPGWNFANQYGEEETRRLIAQNLLACDAILRGKKIRSPLWQELYDKVWGMAV